MTGRASVDRFLFTKFALIAAVAVGLGAGIACDKSGSRTESGTSSAGSSAASSTETREGKVMIVGIDGIDWDIIDRLLAEGRLPNFKRIIDGGVRAPFISLEDFRKSPVIWTSISTGRQPEDHNIHDFVINDVESGALLPVSSNERQVPALWNMLTQHDKSVAVFGMWATYPAETVKGVMVSDRCAFLASKPEDQWGIDGDIRNQLTYPPAFYEQVLPYLDPSKWEIPVELEGTLGALTDLKTTRRGNFRAQFADFHADDVYYMAQSFQEDHVKSLLGEKVLTELEPDFYYNYFRGTDVAEHFFWRYIDPDHFESNPELGNAAFENLIDSYYDYVDSLLGDQMEHLAPEDSLLVVSDHGQMPDPNQQAVLNFEARPNEEAYLARMQNLYKALGVRNPSIGVHEGQEGIRHARNWMKNEFAVTLFPKAAGMTLEELRQVAIEHVEGLTLAEDGTPLFQAVDSPADAPEVSFTAREDALVAAHYDSLVRGVNGDQYQLRDLFSMRKRSGNHRRTGVFIAYGADFKSGVVLEEVSVLDVAPTVLALYNLPRGEEMPGRPVVEAMEGPARQWAENQRTMDYDAEWTQQEGEAMPDQEYVEQMRALGYLGG